MDIKLLHGENSVIDDADFDLVNQYKWHLSKDGYAVRMEKGKYLTIHGLIMNTPKGFHTDHINGNKLDNRRENLRICTASENAMNKQMNKRFKGVSLSWWNKEKWQAYIKKDGKQIKLGYFDTEIEAAEAYNIKALELFGEYAHLNLV